MSTAEIRQQLHNYLEVANDKKVKALFTMMEHDIQASVNEYDDAFKTELDSRKKAVENGSSKLITSAESKRRIAKLLSQDSK